MLWIVVCGKLTSIYTKTPLKLELLAFSEQTSYDHFWLIRHFKPFLSLEGLLFLFRELSPRFSNFLPAFDGGFYFWLCFAPSGALIAVTTLALKAVADFCCGWVSVMDETRLLLAFAWTASCWCPLPVHSFIWSAWSWWMGKPLWLSLLFTTTRCMAWTESERLYGVCRRDPLTEKEQASDKPSAGVDPDPGLYYYESNMNAVLLVTFTATTGITVGWWQRKLRVKP